MSPEHLEALHAGRTRAREHRAVQAYQRVQAYRAWLKAGSPTNQIPEIPKRNDYRLAAARH